MRKARDAILISLFIFSITTLYLPVPEADAFLELLPSKDTYLCEVEPDNNFGEESGIDVGYEPYYAHHCIGLFFFNLSSLPDGTFRLYFKSKANSEGDTIRSLYVFVECNISWNEYEVTWNDNPFNAIDKWNNPSNADIVEEFSPISTTISISINLSQFIGQSSITLLMTTGSNNQEDLFVFMSRENTILSGSPMLEYDWKEPQDNPPQVQIPGFPPALIGLTIVALALGIILSGRKMFKAS